MKFLLSLVLSAALLFSPSCATDTGNPSKDRAGRVTNAVLKNVFIAALNFGMSEGQSYIEGQNGQDAAHAAFLAADRGLISSTTLNDIVTAYAGPQVGAVAAQQFAAANPKTPADAKAVANTIGAAFQQAANQSNPPSTAPAPAAAPAAQPQARRKQGAWQWLTQLLARTPKTAAAQ